MATATERALDVVEILEKILLSADPEDVFRAEAVSKQWQASIIGSIKIQRKLFLKQEQLPAEYREKDWKEVPYTAWEPNTVLCPKPESWDDMFYGDRLLLPACANYESGPFFLHLSSNNLVCKLQYITTISTHEQDTTPTHLRRTFIIYIQKYDELKHDARFLPQKYLDMHLSDRQHAFRIEIIDESQGGAISGRGVAGLESTLANVLRRASEWQETEGK